MKIGNVILKINHTDIVFEYIANIISKIYFQEIGRLIQKEFIGSPAHHKKGIGDSGIARIQAVINRID